MVMMTNSLVLDCVIEFLCKHDQFEEKINVEKSFLEQIAALSQSSVEHILIHHRFGHFSGHELQIYINFLKDNDIDTTALENIKVSDEIMTPQENTQSAMHKSILNTLELMMSTIYQLRKELKEFSDKPEKPLKIKRPSSCIWSALAYDLCLFLRKNFVSTKFGEQVFNLDLFQKKVWEASFDSDFNMQRDHRSYVVPEILKYLRKAQAKSFSDNSIYPQTLAN